LQEETGRQLDPEFFGKTSLLQLLRTLCSDHIVIGCASSTNKMAILRKPVQVVPSRLVGLHGPAPTPLPTQQQQQQLEGEQQAADHVEAASQVDSAASAAAMPVVFEDKRGASWTATGAGHPRTATHGSRGHGGGSCSTGRGAQRPDGCGGEAFAAGDGPAHGGNVGAKRRRSDLSPFEDPKMQSKAFAPFRPIEYPVVAPPPAAAAAPKFVGAGGMPLAGAHLRQVRGDACLAWWWQACGE
jgi:hypothetical protein